jgi:serine/threonine protein kinase
VKDIGVGSFGKVKLAIHGGTRRQYAIKIIGKICRKYLDLNSELN